MRVRDVIKAAKSEVETSDWYVGAIPPSEFKFNASQSSLKQPLSWSWRSIRFTAMGARFCVLLRLAEGKRKFYASLATRDEKGLCRIVCSREFHEGDEPGWHCHAVLRCSQGKATWSHHGMRRVPRGVHDADSSGVALDRRSVTRAAVEFYRLEEPGALL